jgi:astacin
MPFVEAGDGLRFQLLRVSSPGAPALRAHFTDFRLPEGARVYIYGLGPGATAGRVFGPFSGAGPLETEEFWTDVVDGSEMVVELQIAGEPLADLPFRLAEVEAASPPANVETGEASRDGEPEWRVSMYRGAPLYHKVENGLAVFEGDIILGRADELLPADVEREKTARHDSIGISNSRYLWPQGVIPYVVGPGVSTSLVGSAAQHWNTVMAGIIQWVPRTTQANFVYFYASSPATCQSSVGMIGSAQILYLGSYCSVGNTIHEMGHAVGLWHEHTRADRNTKVTVLWQNIMTSAYGNFSQQTVNGFDIGPYDYGSIMHYPANGFSANGLPTIETIPPGIPIGQRSGLSAGDIAGVQLLYSKAPSTPTTTTTSATVAVSPSGPKVAADGVAVTGSSVFQWIAGSFHTLSAPLSYPLGDYRYQFAKWSDGGAASHNVVTPTAPVAYTAYFTRQNKVTATASGGGSVSISPMSADSYVNDGTRLSLTATPWANYCFASWSGLIAGTPATTTLTASQPYALQANFVVGAATVSPTSIVVPASGGTGTISVAISSGCAWTAQSSVNWVQIQTQKAPTGSGVVTYTIPKNTGKLSRTAVILVANKQVAFYQAAR